MNRSALRQAISRCLSKTCAFDFAAAFNFPVAAPIQISISKTKLKKRMAEKEIFSLAQLARQVPCSPTAMHLAIETPTRFSRVISRIQQILEIAELKQIL